MPEIKILDLEMLQNSFYLSKLIPYVSKGIFSLSDLDSISSDNTLLKTKIESELQLRNLLVPLPNNQIDDKYTILVKTNKSIFEKIRYDDYNLVNLNIKFNVRSDLFYNKVNLKSIQLMYPNLDVQSFKKHLLSIGFDFDSDKVVEIRNQNMTYSEEDLIDCVKILFRIDLVNNHLIHRYINKKLNNLFDISKALATLPQKEVLFKMLFIPEMDIEEFVNHSSFPELTQTLRRNGISNSRLISTNKLFALQKSGSLSINETRYLVNKVLAIDTNQIGFSSDELIEFIDYFQDLFRNINESKLKEFQKRFYSDLFVNLYKQKRIDSLKELVGRSNEVSFQIELFCDFTDFVYSSVHLTSKFSVQHMQNVKFNIDDCNLHECVLDFKKFYANKREVMKLSGPEIIEMPINDFLHNIDFSFTEREKEFYILKNVKGFTLEKISKHVSNQEITRERVRQIIDSTEREIETKILKNKYRIKKFLERINGDKLYFSKSQILATIEPRFHDLFKAIDLSVIGVYWSAVLKLYILADKDIDKFFEENIRRNNLSTEVLIDLVEKDFGFSLEGILSKELIYKYASTLGYVDNYSGFSENKPSKRDRYALTISTFENGISLATNLSDFINRYNGLFQDDYLDPLNTQIRNVEARLLDSKDIIVTDTRAFTHLKNLVVSSELKTYVSHILEYEISKMSSITANFLFKKYYEKLIIFGVNNKIYLYSLIKLIEGSKYFYGKGNTLTISTNLIDLKKSQKDKIIELLLESENRMRKTEIMAKMGILGVNIDLIVNGNEEFFGTGEWVFLAESLIPYQSEINLINKSIIDYFQDHTILSANTILSTLLHNQKLYSFFQKFEITDGMKLIWLLNKYTDFKSEGASILIYNEKYGYRSIFQYIIENYEMFSRNEISLLTNELQYSNSALLQIMDEIKHSNIYARISVDEFVKFDILGISNETVKVLLEYLENQILDEIIISKNLHGFRNVLPVINVKWTHYLISDIALRNGYNLVAKVFKDFWTDPIIITKNTELINFENLVRMLINKYNLNRKHYSEALDLMISLGVINSSSKELPQEIRDSNMFYIDELGRLIINE